MSSPAEPAGAQRLTQPDGLAIVMEASHFCMSWRGVREMDSKMLNSVMRGVFLKDPNDPAQGYMFPDSPLMNTRRIRCSAV